MQSIEAIGAVQGIEPVDKQSSESDSAGGAARTKSADLFRASSVWEFPHPLIQPSQLGQPSQPSQPSQPGIEASGVQAWMSAILSIGVPARSLRPPQGTTGRTLWPPQGATGRHRRDNLVGQPGIEASGLQASIPSSIDDMATFPAN